MDGTHAAAAAAGVVDLLAADPALGEAAAGEPPRLEARLVAARSEGWSPPRVDGLGLLVLRGLLHRRVLVSESEASEIVGGGDLILARGPEERASAVPCRVEWTTIEPAELAVLDGRVTRELAAQPALAATLLARAAARAHRLAVQGAIAAQVGVEQRLLLMLWHLADRFGKVTRDGVLLPIPLSHRLLGSLVGAQRPTVTTALGRLQDAGAVARAADGRWLLRGRPAGRGP